MPDVNFNELRDATRNKIKELDELLDSYQDANAAGKRKVKNELITETEGSWTPVVQQLIPQLQDPNKDDRVRYGSYLGFIKALNDAFEKTMNEFIDKVVASQPQVETVKVSDEEKKAVATERAKNYDNFRKLRELVIGFDQADENDPAWALPQTRRANVGKRGPRALSLMIWSLDGQELDEDDNSPKGVATKLGFDKAADLTKALKAAGINTTKPEDHFSVTINDHLVEASMPEDEDEDESEEDEEGEDTEETVETEAE